MWKSKKKTNRLVPTTYHGTLQIGSLADISGIDDNQPCSSPYPCNRTPDCLGICLQQKLICVRGYVARAIDNEFQDMFPSIDSRLKCMINVVTRFARESGVPAPPAMVPSRYGLISITFLTVPDAVNRVKTKHQGQFLDI